MTGVEKGVQDACIATKDGGLLRSLDVGVPPMGAVRPQARLHARGGLAVAVGYEVVGVAPRDRVVRLEVRVRHDVVVVSFEEGDLPVQAGR